jgi:hypothetical protein
MPTQTKTRAVKAAATTQEMSVDTRKPFFCGTQEKIADAVAEMITTGSTEDNLTMVIEAVIDHDWRRRFDEGVREGESSRYAPTFPDREARRMLDDLAVARQKRTKLEVGERPEPADVVARIRETAREQCAWELQELLDSASPEEHRFLSDMLCSYRSAHAGVEGYGHMGLASAFMEEIDRRQNYLRVPTCLIDDVETYMRALIKAYPNGKPKKDAA